MVSYSRFPLQSEHFFLKYLMLPLCCFVNNSNMTSHTPHIPAFLYPFIPSMGGSSTPPSRPSHEYSVPPPHRPFPRVCLCSLLMPLVLGSWRQYPLLFLWEHELYFLVSSLYVLRVPGLGLFVCYFSHHLLCPKCLHTLSALFTPRRTH